MLPLNVLSLLSFAVGSVASGDRDVTGRFVLEKWVLDFGLELHGLALDAKGSERGRKEVPDIQVIFS